MAAGITNNIRPQIDLPRWETFAVPYSGYVPTATSAISCMCSSDDGSNKAIYYIVGAALWRYCSITNSWLQLANLPAAAVTTVTAKFSKYSGYYGIPLGPAPSSTTLEIAGLYPHALIGQTIRIISGKGAGQERAITDITDPTVWVQGVATGGSVSTIVDTYKRWQVNEWVGYQVRIIANTGLTQIRRVLYNDSNTLYFQDNSYYPIENWNNTALVTAAAAGSNYVIESNIITTAAWTVEPDLTSTYVVMSGGIFAFTSHATAANGSSFYYYDVLSDTWTTKASLTGGTQNLITTSVGTDFQIERTGEVGGAFDSGTLSAGATRTATDSTKSWTIDMYRNYQIRILGGTGVGQRRRIVGNNVNTLYFEKAWDTTPDNTSTYSIFGDTNNIYMVGNAGSAIYNYNINEDMWGVSVNSESGVVSNLAITYSGQAPIGLTSGVVNANGITVLAAVPTVKGAGYAVGDTFNITTGGTIGKGRVETISAGGVVETVSLYSAGLNYTTDAGKATTIITGSGNNALTVNITTVASVCRFTSAISHNFAIGDAFTITGASEGAWNTSRTVLGADSLTTFDTVIAGAGASTLVASFSNSTILIVDPTKVWTINEHAGKVVDLMTNTTIPTHQFRRIVSNTATTLTVVGLTAQGVIGTSKFLIVNPNMLARAEQWKATGLQGFGYASSGSATTLVDNTKTWYPNQWAGYKMRIICGSGFVRNDITITSNDATTLTFPTITDTIATTSKYIIMDTFGLATTVTNTTNAVITDTFKNWIINQWAGFRLKIVCGTGTGQEIVITSNTATALTCTGVFTTAPDTTSIYCISGLPAFAAGNAVNWIFGNTVHQKGKKLFLAKGANCSMHLYDLSTELVDLNIMTTPWITETFLVGSYFAYDGANRMYINNSATNRLMYYNFVDGLIYNSSSLPIAHGAGVLGNRMEIIDVLYGSDHTKFLFLAQNTGQILYKSAIIY